MKATYQKMNEYIVPDTMLPNRVMKKITPKAKWYLRPAAVVAAVLAVLMMAVPAMAVTIPAVNELMYMVSPEIAARFSPVQKSDTNAGITMEVVSASVHGTTAELYISFQGADGAVVPEGIAIDEGDILGISPLLEGVWGNSYKIPTTDKETGKVFQMIEHNYSFYSNLLGRYLTVDELYSGKITVYVESVYGYNAAGERVVIEGPWRVTFEIEESDYVGERDDGIPLTTSPARD